MAGMDVDAVLTEEQRQIRFRKVIERKNNRRNRRNSRPGNETNSEDEAIRHGPARSTLFPPLNQQQQQQQQQQNPGHISMNKWAKILQPKVEMILRNYQTLKLENNLSDKLLTRFDAFQNENSNLNINKNEILSYILNMAEEFQHYANLHRYVTFHHYRISVFFNLGSAEPRGSANSLLGSLKTL